MSESKEMARKDVLGRVKTFLGNLPNIRDGHSLNLSTLFDNPGSLWSHMQRMPNSWGEGVSGFGDHEGDEDLKDLLSKCKNVKSAIRELSLTAAMVDALYREVYAVLEVVDDIEEEEISVEAGEILGRIADMDSIPLESIENYMIHAQNELKAFMQDNDPHDGRYEVNMPGDEDEDLFNVLSFIADTLTHIIPEIPRMTILLSSIYENLKSCTELYKTLNN